MTRGTMEDGTTLGITDTDMQDGTAASTAHITADGTVAGTHSGITTIMDIIQDITTDIISHSMLIHGEVRDIRQVRTSFMQAEPQAEEDSEPRQQQAGTSQRLTAGHCQEGHR